MSFEERIRSALAGRAADTHARDDGWAEVERRLDEPSSSDLPSTEHRIGVVVLAFTVFAVAGMFVWNAFRSESPPRGATSSNGYPSPPASGYWIVLPDAPELVGDGSDGVKIVALTNLPDGTLFGVNTDKSGMCCPPVTAGQMVIEESSSACDLMAGDHNPGTSITIWTFADIGQHVFGVPIGSEPPQQPDSVLATLGAHFENLTGDQVVNRGGERGLVASADYPWPEPLCLE